MKSPGRDKWCPPGGCWRCFDRLRDSSLRRAAQRIATQRNDYFGYSRCSFPPRCATHRCASPLFTTPRNATILSVIATTRRCASLRDATRRCAPRRFTPLRTAALRTAPQRNDYFGYSRCSPFHRATAPLAASLHFTTPRNATILSVIATTRRSAPHRAAPQRITAHRVAPQRNATNSFSYYAALHRATHRNAPLRNANLKDH